MVREISKLEGCGAPEGLGRPGEVAEALRTTTGGLAQMRRRGTGPRFMRAGMRRVLYRWTDVEDWLARSAEAPASAIDKVCGRRAAEDESDKEDV